MPDVRETGLSLAEAAEVLEVGRSRVVALRDEGRIHVLDNGKLCPISCEDVADELAARRGETVHPPRYRVRARETQFEIEAIGDWAADNLGLTPEQASRLRDRCMAACQFVFGGADKAGA